MSWPGDEKGEQGCPCSNGARWPPMRTSTC